MGSLSRILPALFLLALFGCAATKTKTKAEGRRVLVEVGMTGRDVVGRIGGPNKVFPIPPTPGTDDQTVTVWEYTMKPPAGFEDAAELVVASGALVVVAVASKGNNLNGLGGFGPDGKVRGVTPLAVAR